MKHPVIDRILADLRLPAVLPADFDTADWPARRAELTEIMKKEVYGYPPEKPLRMTAEAEAVNYTFCAGNATLENVKLTVTLPEGQFTFPFKAAIPAGEGPWPFFVLINFRPEVPDRYLPVEEIIDRGYAVLSLYYNDVAFDGEDGFEGKLAGMLKKEDRCGKIGLWAWAASRVLDWALEDPRLDGEKAAVIGHSRLGKTALVAGALDERFAAVISNDSGCSGAAISRNKAGERIDTITRVFPYWFNESYPQYTDNERNMPFDQHFLLAAAAPRALLVGSAEQDLWADPDSEYLSCCAVSHVWEALTGKGFVHPDRLPVPGDTFQEGNISYHLRRGAHYLSREDWNRYMDFLDKIF